MSTVVTNRLPGGRTHFAELLAQRFKGGQEIGRLLDDELSRIRQVTIGLPTRHGYTHLQNGADAIPPPASPPLVVTVGGTGANGTGPSYILEGTRFVLTTGEPAGLGNAAAEGASSSAPRLDHVHKRDVRVKKNNADVGTRNALDFEDTAGVTWTVTDEAGTDRVRVSAVVVAGSFAPTNAQYLVAAADATLTAERVTTDTATVTWDHGTAGQAKANVPDNAITYAKLQDVAGFSVVGKSTTGSGDAADITAADETVLGRTGGGNLIFAQVATGQIANNAVTDAKLRQGAATSVIGRAANSLGNVADIAASADAQFLSRQGGALSFAAIAYVDLPATAQHWTRTGTLVHLTTSTDQVKVGGATSVIDGALHVFCNAGTRHVTIADHGASANPLLRLRSSLGTETVPTDTTNIGDVLGRFEAQGYQGAYVTGGVMQFHAGQSWTGSARGSRFVMQLIPNAQTTLKDALNVSCVVGGGDDFQWVFNRPASFAAGSSISPTYNFFQSTISGIPVGVLGLYRKNSDSTAPAAGFGGYIAFYMEGFTDDVMAESGRITWTWENTQTNDTTDRDSALAFSTMLNNTLTQRLRLTSAGVLVAGEQDPTILAGILNLSSEASAEHVLGELAASSTDPFVLRFARARGSLGSLSASNAADNIAEFRFDGHRGGAYVEGARLTVDIEGITNNLAGRYTFWTRPDLGMGGVLTRRLTITAAGNTVVGDMTTALATTATAGFFYVPYCGGTPTGAPTVYTGSAAMVYDDTNDVIYIRDSGGTWRAH